MTRTNRILVGAGVGLLLALLVTGYLVSPILALNSLTAAAKAGDRDKLEQVVDFPAVRQNLKIQLNEAMSQSIEDDPKLRDNPFAAFGQILLRGVVDKAVDAYATPDSIADMVAASRAPSKITLSKDAPVEPPRPRAKSETEIHYAYQDLDHFRATYRGKKDDGGTLGLVLKRHGVFGWKLVRVELPINSIKR